MDPSKISLFGHQEEAQMPDWITVESKYSDSKDFTRLVKGKRKQVLFSKKKYKSYGLGL